MDKTKGNGNKGKMTKTKVNCKSCNLNYTQSKNMDKTKAKLNDESFDKSFDETFNGTKTKDNGNKDTMDKTNSKSCSGKYKNVMKEAFGEAFDEMNKI